MCEMGLGPHSSGMASAQLVEKARELGTIREMARRSFPHWEEMICGECVGGDSMVRCRPHLISQAGLGREAYELNKDLILEIRERVIRYCRSFRWEFRGTDTDLDLGGLLAAVGWCSGWRPLLGLLELSSPRDDSV